MTARALLVVLSALALLAGVVPGRPASPAPRIRSLTGDLLVASPEMRDLYTVLQAAQAEAVDAATVGTPCEQPAPASSPYSVWPTNCTAETPLTRLPSAGEVWLEGSPLTTVETTPWASIFEIRPPSVWLSVLPKYGAAAPCAFTWSAGEAVFVQTSP